MAEFGEFAESNEFAEFCELTEFREIFRTLNFTVDRVPSLMERVCPTHQWVG